MPAISVAYHPHKTNPNKTKPYIHVSIRHKWKWTRLKKSWLKETVNRNGGLERNTKNWNGKSMTERKRERTWSRKAWGSQWLSSSRLPLLYEAWLKKNGVFILLLAVKLSFFTSAPAPSFLLCFFFCFQFFPDLPFLSKLSLVLAVNFLSKLSRSSIFLSRLRPSFLLSNPPLLPGVFLLLSAVLSNSVQLSVSFAQPLSP